MFQKKPEPLASGWRSVYKDLIRQLRQVERAAPLGITDDPGRVFGRPVNFFAGENASRLLNKLRGQPEGKAVAQEIAKFAQGNKIKYLGAGLERVAFDIGGQVAKIGMGSAPQMPKLPELVRSIYSRNFGASGSMMRRMHMEIVPKVDTEMVREGMPDLLREQLKSRGWLWSDHNLKNVGIRNGKPVVLDPGFMVKSQLRTSIRTDAMRRGLDPAFISRRLDTTVKQAGLRRPEQLGPERLQQFRREMVEAGNARKAALLRQAKEVARGSFKAGASKGAAGKVMGTAARVMRSI